MALPVQQFPWQKWEDIDAFGSGYMRGQGMYKQTVENQYLQPTLQQALQKAQLDNQILQPQAEFARPMEEAKLAYNQTLAPLNQANIADIYQGRIPLQKAQAGLAGAQTGLANQQTQNERNFPLKDEFNGALSMYRMLSNQYGQNSPQALQAQGVVNVMANKAQAMAAYYGSNADLKNIPVGERYNMVANGYTPTSTLANPINIFGGAQTPPPQAAPAQASVQGAQAPAFTPYQQPNMAQSNAPLNINPMPSNAGPYQPPQLSLQNYLSQQATPNQAGAQAQPLASQIQQMQANPGTPVTPQDIAMQNKIAALSTPQSRDIAQSYIIKGTETAAQQNQKLFAQSFDAMANLADKSIPVAAQFAGLAGKSGATVDKYASALGMTPSDSPQYQTYLDFTRNQAPTMAAEYRRALGSQATDSELAKIESVTNPVSWDTNFDQTLGLYNSMRANMKAQIGVLSKTPNEIQKDSKAEAEAPDKSVGAQDSPSATPPKVNSQDLTPANIKATAQKYGISEAEVKKRLGVK